MTSAGEALAARLQASGKSLVIDTMVFALVDGQDHTLPLSPITTVPTEQVMYTYVIPPEYRSYVNPNQVVYSALLGSDVGDFAFNWQGLYCSEHATLIAVATFPALEKRKFNQGTGTAGNNLTRNFMLEFTGAREITGMTVSADVWQLDFTVRLLGMDERTRLANFDLYGQGYFEGDGWLLRKSGTNYAFCTGVGYVGGIRAALLEALPVVVAENPRDVWLSACLKPQGSDRIAECTPLLVPVGERVADFTDETGLKHYRVLVARVNADGTVTDLRPKRMAGLPPEKIGAAASSLQVIAGAGISGGGTLTSDITIEAEFVWNPLKNYGVPSFVFGPDGKIYTALAPSGPRLVGVGAKQPGAQGSEAYWLDYAESLFAHMMDYRLCQYDWFEDELERPGWKTCLGGLIKNFSSTYPKAAAYFSTPHGAKRLVTKAEYDALHVYSWHANSDGTKVGWNGIGGVNRFVWDKQADTLRLPDLAGMTPEQVGFSDSLGVGGVQGDAERNKTGYFSMDSLFQFNAAYNVFKLGAGGTTGASATQYGRTMYANIEFDASYSVPIAAKNQFRAWGSLACVYLGLPQS